MTSSAFAAYLEFLPFIVLFGLFLDIIGAIILLGPEVDYIAKKATRWERRRLHRLVDKLEKRQYIDESESAFDNLRIAVAQRHWQGETDLPARLENIDTDDLFYNFDVVENRDDGIYLRNFNDSKGFGYNLEDLRRDVDHFTATARLYYSQGGFALVAGFFMQSLGALAEISQTLSFIIFFVGSGFLLYTVIVLWK